MKLAVILPSRGLSFSRTCDELLKELKPLDYRLFFSIGHKLPDCFNIPLEEILKDKSFTHVLIVEDDMIIPKGILRKMFNVNYPLVALDYPFKKNGESTVLHDPDGMALYTGTGFLLIERWLLDMMPKPIFRTDTAWDMMISKDNELLIWGRDVSKIKTYGLHDVHFGLTMWSQGLPILVMKQTTGQRKLRKKGEAGSNSGADEIYEIKGVLRNNVLKTDNEEIRNAFLTRINLVKTVKLLPEKPDEVRYKDGQAVIKGKKYVIA
jgi:hypothetical protein